MATEVLKRHPIRGLLYGIVFGLGLVMVAVGQGWTALGTWPAFIVFVAGLAGGTAWGAWGPSRVPKGPPPPEPVEVHHASPSRFDDHPPSGPIGAMPDRPRTGDAADEGT